MNPHGTRTNFSLLYKAILMKPMLAGMQGLEPQLTVPETVVLPLDDIPIYFLQTTYLQTIIIMFLAPCQSVE
ncbi:MAG: hypothetical protein RI935_164 [Candidatus Parcubacteria bacterium]